MLKLRLLVRLLALPLLAWLGTDGPAAAQVFGFGHVEQYNGMRPGVYMPYEGAGFSHRFNYLDVPSYYIGPFGVGAEHAIQHGEIMVELDREERAFRMSGHLKNFDRLGPILPPDRPPLMERISARLRNGH